MKNFFMLDRNIIDLMKKYNRNVNINDDNASEKLQFLLVNDVVGNFFSPLFSIIEGKVIKKTRESGEVIIEKTPNRKIRELIKEEASVVHEFIKNARTDYNFLISNEKFFAKNIYENEVDGFINEKIKFLSEVSKKIGILKEVSKRENDYLAFKEVCKQYAFLKDQPFVLFSIMYIFGSSRSAKLLKYGSSKFVAYNPISDFNHVKLFNKLRYNERLEGKFNISFLSLDSDIDFINEVIKTNNVRKKRISNFSEMLMTDWSPDYEAIDRDIPNIEKNGSNKDIFYKCYKDFYGYDLRDYAK
ncbi:hypothetical protein ACBP95_17750 [Morganella morganii]|uniref:hypothetical protein n=1 Tax=Morganella morganii TaxID=582 RepID=UPI0035241446